MKLHKLITFTVTTAACAALAMPAVAQESYSYSGDSSLASGWDEFYEDYIQDRLSIGLRVSTFRLKDATRPADKMGGRTFVGFLNKLEEEDDTNVYPTIAWWICPYLALELTYDKVEASTWNYDPLHPSLHTTTDGNIKFSGPIMTLRGQYPFLENRIIPYIGIGIAPWSCSFNESEKWFTRSDGMHRVMEVNDDVGLALTAGVGIRPIRHLEIEAMVRYLDVSTDAEFWYMRGGIHRGPIAGSGEFTLEHIAYGLAASYVF